METLEFGNIGIMSVPVALTKKYKIQKIRKFGCLKADVTKAVDLQVRRFKDKSTEERFIW